MMIDRIGSANPITLGNNSNLNNQVSRSTQTDSIKLSLEALEKSELYQVIEAVNSAPDVRLDVIADVKRQINDPSFITDAVLEGTADKILAVFEL